MSGFERLLDHHRRPARHPRPAGQHRRRRRQDPPTASGLSDGIAVGFFAGSGGDRTAIGALLDRGWEPVCIEADYHWCLRSPVDGSHIAYVEGDLDKSDRKAV